MDSFSRFYLAQREVLFGYLIRRTGDSLLASDILQETFLRLFSSYGSDGQNRSLLYTIARNLLIDHYKKKKANEPFDEEPPDFSMNPEKQVMVKESYKQVLNGLKQLNEDERDVLALAATGGLSYREIGEITGISEGNVKVKVHRARMKLRDILKEVTINGISD